MVQLLLALATSLGMDFFNKNQGGGVSFHHFFSMDFGREGTGVWKSHPSRRGFCGSFGCYDSHGWLACCGPCPSRVSKCGKKSIGFDPGIYWCRWKKRWCFQDWTQIFFQKRYLLKEILSSGSIAGFYRLPQTPEVDDFDQRNGSSNHLRHLAISSYRRWRFDELHVLYRMDWWILIFDIFWLHIYI